MFRFASLAAATALATTLWANDPGTQLVTIDQPSESADLQHDGLNLAMRYHFVDGQMEVVAVFQDGKTEPREVVLRMDDGQSLSFALPGHRGGWLGRREDPTRLGPRPERRRPRISGWPRSRIGCAVW